MLKCKKGYNQKIRHFKTRADIKLNICDLATGWTTGYVHIKLGQIFSIVGERRELASGDDVIKVIYQDEVYNILTHRRDDFWRALLTEVCIQEPF